jgi:hypothetical protein
MDDERGGYFDHAVDEPIPGQSSKANQNQWD